ncbi:hypothetical protein ACHAWF_009391 [Thalassiosira exigua]
MERPSFSPGTRLRRRRRRSAGALPAAAALLLLLALVVATAPRSVDAFSARRSLPPLPRRALPAPRSKRSSRFLASSEAEAPPSPSSGPSAASRWMDEERRWEEEAEEEEEEGASDSTDASADVSPPPPPLGGRWEFLGGNHVLRPPHSSPSSPPRALLHFLGGALVGAAPQASYRYLLERLSSRGYLIVATPYRLSFDHLKTCDDIVSKFEAIAPSLAREYGAVPVVGVGHSCGALLHMLITSLFPDTPRAANALISYNNKQVTEAVPFFEEAIVPLFSNEGGNGSELMKAALGVARETVEGKVPSDESLLRLLKSLPTPIPGLADALFPPSLVSIPAPMRRSLAAFLAEPKYDALSNAGATSLLLQSLDVARQVPALVDEVASGARDFVPPPDASSAAARRAYRCRRTLLVQFADDPLDESEVLEGYLREAESVMKTKRPMITVDLRRRELPGNHATPLLGPSGGEGWAEGLEGLLGGALGGGGGGEGGGGDGGAKAVREALGYEQVERVVDELVAWLDEGSL